MRTGGAVRESERRYSAQPAIRETAADGSHCVGEFLSFFSSPSERCIIAMVQGCELWPSAGG